MKKVAKIAAIIVGVFIVLLIALPLAFRGKIAELVKTEGNKMLNAEFDFASLDISLIRHFPQASLTLEDFWLKGKGEFERDTLVQAGELTATVNLFSLFGDSGYDISRIYIEDTRLHAIVLEDGRANWDVMKTDSATAEPAATEEESGTFRIKLQRVELDGVDLIYDDRQGDMYAEVRGLTLGCRGDLSGERSMLQLKAETDGVTYRTGGVPFLNDARITAKLDVDADFANGRYELKDNTLTLNAIEANLDGWIQTTGAKTDMDVKLHTNDMGFKEILSLIPAIYAKDFDKLKTDGTATLAAYAKGTLAGDTVPAFKVALDVKDAMFRYPDLPAGVDQINIQAGVENPGGPLDGTTVTVRPLSFRLAGNPFTLTAQVKTPVSDPDFAIGAQGTVDLGMVKQVYPLEDMELNGVIKADMNVAGRMSSIEKGQYDAVNAKGTIALNDMKLKMDGMPDVDIRKSLLTFTPQYLQLSETTVNIGQNDLTADSRFENYMGYALKGSTLRGTLNISSNHLNLNDFMSADTTAATVPADTTVTPAASSESSLLVVPKNIDFTMQANLKKVLFDTMTFDNVNGKLTVRGGDVDMSNLSLGTMGGNVVINGCYSTADPKAPAFNAGLRLTDLSFAQTYKELNMVQQLAPIFENLKGTYSGHINIDTQLDQAMSPVLSTLKGDGNLSTRNLNLSGVKAIDGIADAINKPEMKNLDVKDMDLDFTISEGRITTKPFDLKLGDYTLNLSGSTGLDQTIDYSGKVQLPASSKLAEYTTFDLKIGGTFTSPSVKVDARSMANQALKAAGTKALDKLLGGKDSTATEEQGEKKNVVDKVLNIFKKKK